MRWLTCSFLGGGITATDNSQRFVPEDGDRTVADSTCADATLPIGIFTLETHTLRAGTSGNDDGVRSLGLLVFLTLAPVSERTSRKVDTGNSLSDDRCAEPEGLCAELVHEFGAEDSSREAREVLDCGLSEHGQGLAKAETRTISSCGQLTPSGEPICHETLEKNRLEVGPSQIDGCGVSCGSRADDDLGRVRSKMGGRIERRDNLRLWNAFLCSSRVLL